MEKERYLISDASLLTGVESHVLRYWEDELELKVPRNEQGHRYYTKENIAQFRQIKELKERGYQLKTIRIILHNPEGEEMLVANPPAIKETENCSLANRVETGDKMQQFREIMDEIVGQAIARNNEELSRVIGQEVQERVLKEMDYLMREQEALEEERYRKLDAAIRGNLRKRRFKSAVMAQTT